MANRTTRTPEKEQAILRALELHPSKSRACRAAKVPRRTFYEWLAADVAFKAQVDAAQDLGIDAVEDALFNDAVNHDTTAAIFTLKSWRPDRYRETTQHDHRVSGTVAHDHRLPDFSVLTLEQRFALDQALAAVEEATP